MDATDYPSTPPVETLHATSLQEECLANI